MVLPTRDIPLNLKVLASVMERRKSMRQITDEVQASYTHVTSITRILKRIGLVRVHRYDEDGNEKMQPHWTYEYTPNGWSELQDSLKE